MEEILRNTGFTLISQCSCGGTLTQTWKKQVGIKSYEVKSMPKRGRFEIRLSNTRIDSGKENELYQKLKDNAII